MLEELEEAISSLFNQPRLCFGDSENAVEYIRPSNGQRVRLSLCDASRKNTALMAHFLWKSSRIMADMVDSGIIKVQNKRILELGAGAGLPSLVSAVNGAKKVSCTDYPAPEIIANIKTNKVSWETELSVNLDNLEVRGFDWNDEPSLSFGEEQFDLILLADTFWMSDMHERLLYCVNKLLVADGRVYITVGNHAATGNPESDDKENLTSTSRAFLELASRKGWAIRKHISGWLSNADYVFTGYLERQ